ncbi:MAG: branched-chain-amino-acid transaminase [Pseudomonadota bacterium]|nr:branched-chain-amino-acid transaminase [Pseudomonadota bacterium]
MIAPDIDPMSSASGLPRPEALGFGRYLGPHVVTAEHDGARWSALQLSPREALGAPVASAAVQYGLSVFEGLKAYRGAEGGVHLFRPQAHAHRFAASAARLGLPTVDEALFVESCAMAVDAHRKLLPPYGRGSLYLRPTIHADEEFLGLRRAQRHRYSVVVSACSDPAMKRLRLWAEPQLIRAAVGGLGAAKTGANYAAGLTGLMHAQAKGYDDVVWLDAATHTRLGEAGSMNLFVRIGSRLLTPPLDGCILAGITRDSLLQMARRSGLDAVECDISLDDLAVAQQRGELGGAFGCGTAARVAAIDEIGDAERSIRFSAQDDCVTELCAALKDVQEGATVDWPQWRHALFD